MNEKIYKTMSRTGACSIAVGIITLVTGVAAGVLMIVSMAKKFVTALTVKRKKIMVQIKEVFLEAN